MSCPSVEGGAEPGINAPRGQGLVEASSGGSLAPGSLPNAGVSQPAVKRTAGKAVELGTAFASSSGQALDVTLQAEDWVCVLASF